MIKILDRIQSGEEVVLMTSEGHKLTVSQIGLQCYRVSAPKLFKSKKFLTFEGVRNLLVRELPPVTKESAPAAL